jgi:hypothetical protein
LMFPFSDPIVRMLIRSLYSEHWTSNLEVSNSPFSKAVNETPATRPVLRF